MLLSRNIYSLTREIYVAGCFFFKVIAYYMTVQVMWKVPAWGLTFRLPQQTVIIQIANQGAFTKCSSFQIGRVIVTVEFTPF